MSYEFPVADHISDYLPCIEGREEFYVAHRPESGISIINYRFVMTDSFPDPNLFSDPIERRKAALRRDCRGLKFDIETGKVVTKAFQKFKNLNEDESCFPQNIDWSKPHHILEKLDGSFMTPFVRKDGVREWHSKMGATDVAKMVDDFVLRSPIDYDSFNDVMRIEGYTPIYEFCSRLQKIVVDYPVDMLILTGIRHNVTGQIVPYPEMKALAENAGIPVVRALPGSVQNIETFMAEANGLVDAEGYVIRFLDGMMYKIKAEQYRLLHRAKDNLGVEKTVWAMILDDILDDALPLLSDADRVVVEAFADDLNKATVRVAEHVQAKFDIARKMCDNKRDFAIKHVNVDGISQWERPIMFSMWDGKEALSEVRKYLLKHTSSQTKVDEVRGMVGGLRWLDYYHPVDTSED